MAQQLRNGRTRQEENSLVPLLTGLVVIAAAGPALFTALTSWLLPRLSAGGASASLTLAEWWAANTWLVAFWAVELVGLLAFLAWSRRRGRRRQRQLDSVAAGLARVLPHDWEPARHLRVLRWRGHHPVRLRVELTPRSPVADRAWRESVTDAARTALGPLAPIAWPSPPRGGAFDWGRRPPRIELRRAPAEPDPEPLDSRTKIRLESMTSASAEPRTPPQVDLPIYRRPRPNSELEPTPYGRED